MVVRKRKRRFMRDFEGFYGGEFYGYSIEIIHTDEGVEVRARTYGNADPSALREELRRRFPGARIIVDDEEEEIGAREIRPLGREPAEKKVTIRLSDEEEEEERPTGGNKVTIKFDESGNVIIEKHDEKNESKGFKSIFDLFRR